MDVCLTEAAPAERKSQLRVAIGPHWIRWAVFSTIAAGLIWRFTRYLGQFPIWGDEAMLLLNILERDYVGLIQHLRFAQVAPLLFLWLEKTALVLFGASEASVHLFPFIAGVAAFMLFWQMCQRTFSPTVAGFAVCVLAVAYYPIRHACEVKPYAFDLLYSTAFASLTLARLTNPHQTRWLVALTLMAPIAVFSSYPSVFVAGAVSLVLLPSMRTGSWTERAWFATFNVGLLASFLVHYGMIGHHQIDAEEAARTREFLRTYWKDAFPPEEFIAWPWWLVKTFTGNMLAYPIGAKNGGSALTLALVLLGTFSLWQSDRTSLLALCWLPFGLNFLAAALNKYPFGDSARITLHLAPFICILMGHGFAQTLDWIRDPVWRSRLHLSVHLVLLAYACISVGRDVAMPYKTEHDREVRLLARDLGKRVAPGELVLLGHQRDEELIPELLWYLRTQPLDLRWQSAGVESNTRSYWLVECGNREPLAPTPPAGWTVETSDVRFVPSENKVIPPMYCRWTHFVCR